MSVVSSMKWTHMRMAMGGCEVASGPTIWAGCGTNGPTGRYLTSFHAKHEYNGLLKGHAKIQETPIERGLEWLNFLD